MTENGSMLEGSRTENSIRNVIYAFVSYIAKFVASFFFRMLFIRMLGNSYAGVEGVFQTILYVFSFADLGLESVMSYHLYSPIAYGRRTEISSIMYRYRRYSVLIFVAIMLLTLAFMPFLHLLVDPQSVSENIYLLFFAFSLSIALDSFNKYQKTFINACQNQYVTTLAHYLSGALMDVLQIAVILIFRNYQMCLYLQALGIFLEWIIEKTYIKRKYGNIYILYNPVSRRARKEIKPYLYSVSLHKVSDILLQYSDTLVVSVLYGIVTTGIYANYRYILYALNSVFFMLLESCAAAVGELAAKKRTDDERKFYFSLQLINSWIYGFAGACLYILMNPFIHLWIGENSLFKETVMILIVLKFYVEGIKKGSFIYRDALGLFVHDRYVQFIEFGLFLGMSVGAYYLGLGIEGVLISSILSSLLTDIWKIPDIVFRKGLGEKTKLSFYVKEFLYFIYMIISCIILKFMLGSLTEANILNFVIKTAASLVVPNVVFLICTSGMGEFRYIYGKLIKHIKNKFRKKSKG